MSEKKESVSIPEMWRKRLDEAKDPSVRSLIGRYVQGNLGGGNHCYEMQDGKMVIPPDEMAIQQEKELIAKYPDKDPVAVKMSEKYRKQGD